MYESDLHLAENRPCGKCLCMDAICRTSRICTWEVKSKGNIQPCDKIRTPHESLLVLVGFLTNG